MLAQRQEMVCTAAVEVNRRRPVPAHKDAQLLPARPFVAKFAASPRAWLPIAGAAFVILFSGADVRAQGSSGVCEDAAELAVLSSPIAPWKGAPLRVVFAAEKPLEGEFSLIAPDGSVAVKSRERRGGDRKSTRLNSSHPSKSRMPSSA